MADVAISDCNAFGMLPKQRFYYINKIDVVNSISNFLVKNVMLFTLNFEGKIYKDHLSALTQNHVRINSSRNSEGTVIPQIESSRFSSQGLIVFAKLTSLMENRKISSAGYISTTTTNISRYICQGNVISGRMVRHQINLLTKEAPLLISNKQFKNTCQLFITKPENREYLPIFGIQKTDETGISAEYISDCTLMLIISLLLDRAAFNYRCGKQFCVSSSQLEQVIKSLNITDKTLINTLNKMSDYGIILPTATENSASPFKGREILNSGILFSENILNEYSKLIKLKQSKKAITTKVARMASQKSYTTKKSKQDVTYTEVCETNKNSTEYTREAAELLARMFAKTGKSSSTTKSINCSGGLYNTRSKFKPKTLYSHPQGRSINLDELPFTDSNQKNMVTMSEKYGYGYRNFKSPVGKISSPIY